MTTLPPSPAAPRRRDELAGELLAFGLLILAVAAASGAVIGALLGVAWLLG